MLGAEMGFPVPSRAVVSRLRPSCSARGVIGEGRPPRRPVSMQMHLDFGRDDLRVVRYRCSCIWILGGTTSASSGIDADRLECLSARSESYIFQVIPKVLAVDTEVDPPSRNNRHNRAKSAVAPAIDEKPFFERGYCKQAAASRVYFGSRSRAA